MPQPTHGSILPALLADEAELTTFENDDKYPRRLPRRPSVRHQVQPKTCHLLDTSADVDQGGDGWEQEVLINKTPPTPAGNSVQVFLDGTQLITMQPDEQALWDGFVDRSPSAHLLQCWAWGELKRAFGWTPMRVALWDPASQRIVAGAQVLLRSLPLIGYSMAYIPKGPVLDWSNAAGVELFFAGLHAFLRSQRVAFLRVEPELPKKVTSSSARNGEEATSSPDSQADAEAPLGDLPSVALGAAVARHLSNIGFHLAEDHVQQLRTSIVDLAPEEAVIKQRQKPKWRYNTNLAARKGVSIRLASSLDDLRHWYELMEVTRLRDGFASRTFSYYQRAWELLKAADQAEVFLAEQEEKLLAGIFATKIGKQSIYLYGASSNKDRHLMPNHLLQWEAMRWAKSHGATLYDLWGIADTDDPADPLAGITQFKRGWGGNVVEYLGAFDYIYAPLAYRLFLAGNELIRQIDVVRAHLRRRRAAAENAQLAE